MKKFFLVVMASLFVSCGAKKEVVQIVDGQDGNQGSEGSSCSTKQLENGALIQCGDGSFSYIFNGSSGSSGSDGTSCTVEANELGALITCTDGSSASIFNGESGSSGDKGDKGDVGQSCSLEEIKNGALITCGEESVAIYNGEDSSSASNVLVHTYNSGCLEILDTGMYIKYNGTNASLYNNSSCSGSKIIQINNGESYWIAENLLGVKSKNTFKVIEF